MDSVTKRQVVLLGIAMVLETNLISLPNQIVGAAQMDAWLSYPLAMLAILIPLWLSAKLLTRFPGQDLFGILVTRHPVIGRVAGLVIVLFIFILVVRDIRVLTEFVNITLLPSTPLMMISLLVAASIVLTARGGVEVIARMMELWLPLFIIMLALIPFLLYSEFDTRNFMPMFDRGLLPPLQGSWYAVAYIGEIMLLPFLFASSTFRLKEAVKGLAIGTLLLLVVYTYMILALGVNLSSKMLFPFYETMRLIRVTDFLDRFDLPYIMLFLPLMIVKTGFLMCALSHGIKKLAPVLSMKEFLVPLGVWCFVSSFWFFRNSIELFSLNRPWPVFALVCEVALPCMFFLFLHQRKTIPQK
jgi:spore germination protein